MSGGLDALALKEEDVTKFLACSTHLGAQNADFQMEAYVYKRKPDGKMLATPFTIMKVIYQVETLEYLVFK